MAEGLYSGLVSSPFAAAHAVQGQMEAKLKLLVEAPAAVEDALASLMNHVDSQVQVSRRLCTSCFLDKSCRLSSTGHQTAVYLFVAH